MNVYRTRKGASSALIASVIILGMVAAGAIVYIAVGLKPGSAVNTTAAVNTSVNSGAPLPTVGVTMKSANTLTAASVSETNGAYNFWDCGSALGSKTWSQVGSLYGITPTISSLTKGTQSTFTAPSNSISQGSGCGFGILSVYAGDTTYSDVSKVLSGGNPGSSVAAYKWGLATTLGRNDLLVQLLYAPLGTPNYQLSPNLAVTFTNAEFVQTTASSVTVTDAYTSHQIKAIGTTANTVQQVKWTMAAITSTDAIAVAKFNSVTNDSTTAPTLVPQQLTFGDNLPSDSPALTGSNFQYNVAGQLTGISAGNIASLGYSSSTVTHQYQYWPGNNGLDPTQVANGIIFPNPSQSVGDSTITISTSLSLTSNEEVSLGLSVVLIAGNGAYTTVSTDTVTLCAATLSPC